MTGRSALILAGDLVDQCLGHIRQHGQAAAGVAIESAVAGRDFALVPVESSKAAQLVRQGHEDAAADTCLQVLSVTSAGRPAKAGARRFQVGGKHGLDEIVRNEMPSAAAKAAASVREWSEEKRDGMDTPARGPAPKARAGQAGHHRRVDAARKPDPARPKTAASGIVAGSQHQGFERRTSVRFHAGSDCAVTGIQVDTTKSAACSAARAITPPCASSARLDPSKTQVVLSAT